VTPTSLGQDILSDRLEMGASIIYKHSLVLRK
jgi:hypothetical protein